MPDLVKASQYLVDPVNLVDGHYYSPFGGGFADWGLTIDGAFALAATGDQDAALEGIVDYMNDGGVDGFGSNVGSWTGIGTPYVSGGALGKEALLAEVVGHDPRNFSGADLIAALDQSVCPAAAADGSCAAAGNYLYSSSVFSQALGIMAQRRADDSANAAAPIAYLESLQNADGSFPSLIPSSGDEDVDSTAMAIMALDLVPGDSDRVARGIAWIAGTQEADGGFPGAAGDSVNSAALAIQGLYLGKSTYTSEIAKAEAFLASQQNTDGGFNVAAGGQPGSDVRASTQATGGAVGTSFGTLSIDLSGKQSASPSPTRSQTSSPKPQPMVTVTSKTTSTVTTTHTVTTATTAMATEVPMEGESVLPSLPGLPFTTPTPAPTPSQAAAASAGQNSGGPNPWWYGVIAAGVVVAALLAFLFLRPRVGRHRGPRAAS